MVSLRRIPKDPILSLGILSFTETGFLPYPLGEKDLILFGFGRAALYEGLKFLNIKAGENILLPNYICNVVMAPIHNLRLDVKFYEVNDDLKPNWYSVETSIDDKTRALLIVNYFGFPNDLSNARKICEKYKLFFIEDNAHGFLSSNANTSLGSYGDISIFSFRKTLPIPNGAALVLNNKKLIPKEGFLRDTTCSKQNTGFRFIVSSFLRQPKYYLGIRFRKNKPIHFFSASEEEFSMDNCFINFSRMSDFIIRHMNFSDIVKIRRQNYLQWLDFFSHSKEYKAKIVFDIIPQGVVPYAFPVIIEDQRNFILEMWNQGIECFPWPFLPKASTENYLSKRMVCLPVWSNFKFNQLNLIRKSSFH